MNDKSKLIKNFKNNLESFIWLISYHYPLNPEQIRKYSEKLNFSLLGSNKKIKWDFDLLKEFNERLNWDTLKLSKSKKITYHKIC